MDIRFDGKVALVTGASSGMGRGAALAFAEAGAKVVVAARREEQGSAVARAIHAQGGEALFVRTDVTRSADIERLVRTAVERFGRLDVAFNNAGTEGKFGPIDEGTETDWDHTLDTNLKAVWLCIKHEVAAMKRMGHGGAIVNTSSWLAKGALAGSAIYSASKAGLDGMTRALALELGPAGIRVNNINPGIIDTEMLRRFLDPATPAAKPYVDHTPLKRIGSEDEIAKAALWLCSDAASFVTGETLLVDGGFTVAGVRIA